MDDIFDFSQELMQDGWLDDASNHFGLSDDEIVQSVQEASSFFNMGEPMIIQEGWTTGVMNGLPMTESDDILIFNKEQMRDMGISDKMSFDLVMTHEGAHRALQGKYTGFSDHQEELCCDYMAGVRAGLNGLDEGKMAASLADTVESSTHPDGASRVEAIEAGVAFAHDYMDAHNGMPPSFSDCLEHFEQSDICKDADKRIVNLRPEDPNSISESELNRLNKKADRVERHDSQNEIKEFKMMCPTRHGCQGATNCDYSLGNYPG